MSIGTPRAHRRVTGSTNDDARELALAGAPHGTLVTADRQTRGRGRRGRSWETSDGALLMSVVLREVPDLLPLRVAVAARRTCGARARLKWPNDVLIDGRKVAGILCERRAGEAHAVAGVGINVVSAPGIAGAGTLGLAPAEIEPRLHDLLTHLGETLGMRCTAVIAEFAAHDALNGCAVAWDQGEGIARGLDSGGRLLVETPAGEIALEAGEVSLVRAA